LMNTVCTRICKGFSVSCRLQGTREDQCRIVRHRLKPKGDDKGYIHTGIAPKQTDLQRAFTQKWMASPSQGGVPALIYELVQLGCWQPKPDNRPSAEVLVKVMRWHLEDTLMAAGRMTQREGLNVGADCYADKVFAVLGWASASAPDPPKKHTCDCHNSP
jgi:hypothetical protein